jgi:hypothetical protein
MGSITAHSYSGMAGGWRRCLAGGTEGVRRTSWRCTSLLAQDRFGAIPAPTSEEDHNFRREETVNHEEEAEDALAPGNPSQPAGRRPAQGGWGQRAEHQLHDLRYEQDGLSHLHLLRPASE